MIEVWVFPQGPTFFGQDQDNGKIYFGVELGDNIHVGMALEPKRYQENVRSLKAIGYQLRKEPYGRKEKVLPEDRTEKARGRRGAPNAAA